MMPSRGMGAINPKKVKTIKKRDGNEPVKLFKQGGEIVPQPPKVAKKVAKHRKTV